MFLLIKRYIHRFLNLRFRSFFKSNNNQQIIKHVVKALRIKAIDFKTSRQFLIKNNFSLYEISHIDSHNIKRKQFRIKKHFSGIIRDTSVCFPGWSTYLAGNMFIEDALQRKLKWKLIISRWTCLISFHTLGLFIIQKKLKSWINA